MAYKREVYRPCFSKEDLTTITALVAKNLPESKLHNYLSLFLMKINVGVNSPAFVAQEKKDSLDIGLNLGSTKSIEQIVAIGQTAPNTLSPQERYEYLAALWNEDKITFDSPEYAEGKALEFELKHSNFMFM